MKYGCVTNTTEYIARLDIIRITRQNVEPIINLMMLSMRSGVHFMVSVPPALGLQQVAIDQGRCRSQRRSVAGTQACSSSCCPGRDNGTDPHSQKAAEKLAGISSHPQDMKRVLVMFDPVVKPDGAAIYAFA